MFWITCAPHCGEINDPTTSGLKVLAASSKEHVIIETSCSSEIMPLPILLDSRDGAVTDRAVTSKSPKTSPHGPSPHGLGTSEAPVARD
eukprot:2757616-Pyramimonas_sp.AAC.1